MRLLIDTHIFLWWMMGDARLSSTARSAIYDSRNEVFLSSVSAVEISIKFRLGKLKLTATPDDLFFAAIKAGLIRELPLTISQAVRLADLPEHHRDPFDRMLVSQAIDAAMTLVSADEQMAAYGIRILR